MSARWQSLATRGHRVMGHDGFKQAATVGRRHAQLEGGRGPEESRQLHVELRDDWKEARIIL